MPNKKTGSQVLLSTLEKAGVELMLGYTGGAIMPTFDELPNHKIRFITVRHEQGAGFIAQGYTRASGKIAPVLVTSGPGATNTITAVADAKMDSVPMLVISGQVATTVVGSDAFQESDITGMMYTCTKHAEMPLDADEVADTTARLLYIATHGRPGPVALDIPKNVQSALTEAIEPSDSLDLPGLVTPPKNLNMEQIEEAARLVNFAKRPMLLVGHGVILGDCQQEILDFLEKTQIPAGMTLHGISAVPASHPLNLGMIGQHGEIEANRVVQDADLIIALGMRFDDRVTAKLSAFAKRAKVIHIEIDPSEINKNKVVDVGIHADLKPALKALTERVSGYPKYIPATNYFESNNAYFDSHESVNRKQFLDALESRSEQFDEILKNRLLSTENYKEIFTNGYGANGKLLMARVIHELSEFTKGQDNIISDVGQHQMFAAKFYKYERFNTWFNSGGLGTMGFGLPAAIGVKLARPEEEVWSINGDGGIQMNIQELAVMAQERLNINVVILNNSYLGMVKQWQNLFFDDNLVETEMTSPDFSKIAEAYGLAYRLVDKLEEVKPAFEWAKEEVLPTIVEVVCDKSEHVYPMISSTMAYQEMIINEADARDRIRKMKTKEAPG